VSLPLYALFRHLDEVEVYVAGGKEKREVTEKEMEDLDASGSYLDAGKSERIRLPSRLGKMSDRLVVGVWGRASAYLDAPGSGVGGAGRRELGRGEGRGVAAKQGGH